MGDVVDLTRARNPRTNPTARVIAQPTRRDQVSQSQFAEFTPQKLGRILQETERGIIVNYADLCDRMAVDSTVKAAIESRYSAVSSARWVVEPGDPTGVPARDRYSEDARAYVERVYRDIEAADAPTDYREVGGFDQAISNLLSGVGNGLAVCEIDWRYVDGDWVPGRLPWIHMRRFRYSQTWEPRLVDTGTEYHSDGIELELGKFIVHSPRPIAAYPTMTGALRSVVWPYLFKRWGQQFWLSGAERFAWPFMWALVDRNSPAEMRDRALSMLEQLSTDHAAVIDAGSEVKMLESTVKDGGTWKEFHAAMNAEISKGIQGMADAAESQKIGAYGAVEARKGISVDARIARDERDIAATIRRHLTWWLLWFNRHRFGGAMPPVPHVRWTIAGKKNEIPRDAYSAASRNEVREALSLPPLAGSEGLAMMEGGGISDAQARTLMDITASVERGERTPETAALLISLAIPQLQRSQAEELMRVAAIKSIAATPAANTTDLP